MSTDRPLYITTAIPFVNARPHVGFALELCLADALARHARQRGRPVQLVTGTDDHSLKNVLAAERAGRPTSEYVAEQGQRFVQLSAALEISVDRFVHTSQHPGHGAAVHALWRACLERGALVQKPYRGLYCVGCERFAEPAEQRCPEHDAELEWVEENNWFLRLADTPFADSLRAQIDSGELSIPHSGAREETLAFLREPLRDLCVSRSAERARSWGLRVPGDDSQVIWVWFDALTYYLSALGHGSPDREDYERYWAGSHRLHVIGKGITRFHAVFWPAILASAGLPAPDELLVHGYLTLDGEKISKSGRTLDPLPLLEELGSDALRYYLLRHIRSGRDGDFSRARLIQAYNAELANGLGNLVDRLLGLIQRASHSVLPAAPATAITPTACQTLLAQARALPRRVDLAIERRTIDEALDAVFELVHAANRCIDACAPWALIKRGELDAACSILLAVLEAVRVLSVELAPFLPRAARELRAALQLVDDGGLVAGSVLPERLGLFPRRA